MRYLFVAAFCAFLTPAGAADKYYGDGERGWYWYEIEPEPVIPEPIEEEPVEEPPQVMVLAPPPEAEPSDSEPMDPAGPAPLSSKWLKENMDNYLFEAMDNPTPENVSAYLYLHRLMMDRSQKFAEAGQLAYAMEPMLSNDIRRPRSQAASSQFSRDAEANRNQVLSSLGEDTKLFYFMDSSCKGCATQVAPLKAMESRFGFELVWVTTDGKVPENMQVQAISDPRIAKAFNVSIVPSIYAVKGQGRPVHMTSAVLSQNDFENNLIYAAYGQGWISEQEMESTRPRENYMLSVDLATEMPEGLAEDPAKMVEFLRERILKP